MKQSVESGIELTKEEYQQAHAVEKMMQSEAWAVVQGYVEQQIQSTLNAMDKARREDNWRYQQGMLKGMKAIAQIPSQIVLRAQNAQGEN